MIILGIHGGFNVHQHDPSAALIIDGKLHTVIEEERLLRVKGCNGILPIESVRTCLNNAKINLKDVDYIVLDGKTHQDIKERTKDWLKHHFGFCPKIKVVNHQLAHLSSAYFQSGFENALCISYDAWGDRLSGAVAVGNKDSLNIISKIPGDNSLGVFYSTMTSFLGFKPNDDEYKVMGLAPYGKSNFDLSFFLKSTNEGFFCDNSYFRKRISGTEYEQFYSQKLIKKLGVPRKKNDPFSKKYLDIAASTQKCLEEVAISFIKKMYEKTKQQNLCLAGGVALNCSLNGKIAKLPFIKNIFIQPAASDRGLALGSALYLANKLGDKIEKINNVFYGPKINKDSIKKSLDLVGINYKKLNYPSETAANLITDNKVIGWYQDRSEFGPRALGNRSILANPANKNMKNIVNKKIKFREEFRPFAPSVLEEKYNEIFDLDNASPFMTIACNVNSNWKKKIPSTTHINGTARVQTVNKKFNKKYYDLIKNFQKNTNIPVVLNTSFNIKGQPIVEKPLEAISTFAGTGLDCLIIEDYMLVKNK